MVVELGGDLYDVLRAYGVGGVFRRVREAVAGQVC
jgi:hypothetical protein